MNAPQNFTVAAACRTAGRVSDFMCARRAAHKSGFRRTAARRAAATAGFTLLEMMITLAIFILLVAAVFGLMTGVFQSTAVLEDNSNRADQVAALHTYLHKKLTQLPAGYTIISYLRGQGEGLNQNGILFGNASFATAIDAKSQPNGYYALRVATYSAESSDAQQQDDARNTLQNMVTADDPTLSWTVLMTDIKTLDWKFQDFNLQQWLEQWNSGTTPNLVELTFQPAGDLQPSIIDFWIPQIQTINLRIAPAPSTGGT